MLSFAASWSRQVIAAVLGQVSMARMTESDEDERKTLLRGLTEVGPTKPIGYLPLHTIRDFVRLSPEALAAEAEARGLATKQFGPDTSCIKSGALYVYDREALRGLLQAHADAVSVAGLPRDPDRFVAHIAAVWYTEDHPAYRVIARALTLDEGRAFARPFFLSMDDRIKSGHD